MVERTTIERTTVEPMGGLFKAPILALALVLSASGAAHADHPEAPRTRVATASVAPAEQSQEALLRELAQPPVLPLEMFTDLQYAVPAPIIGGLGVEVE